MGANFKYLNRKYYMDDSNVYVHIANGSMYVTTMTSLLESVCKLTS